MKNILLISLLLSSILYSIEVSLTQQQLNSVKEKLTKDTKDYTQYGFSNSEKEEYYKLNLYTEEVLTNKEDEKFTDQDDKILDRLNTLQDKLLEAIRKEKSGGLGSKERVLFSFSKNPPKNFKIIHSLMKSGVNINAVDKHGWTPLLYAVRHNKEDVVKILLDAGAKVNIKNNQGNSPLFYAILKRDINSMDIRQKVNLRDMAQQFGSTKEYIKFAETMGNPNIVKLLLEKGANPNGEGYLGHTLLTESSQYHSDISIVKLLIEHGADTNKKGPHGLMPLHYASMNYYKGSLELVKYLIKNKAQVNTRAVQTNPSSTPIGIAAGILAQPNTQEIIKTLIKNGAKVDKYVLSSAHYNSYEITKLLFSSNCCNLNDDAYGLKLIHYFSHNDDPEVLRFLLKKYKDVDINSKSKYGDTPLHYSIKSYNPEITNILINAGGNKYLRNDDNETPLDLAQKSLKSLLPYIKKYPKANKYYLQKKGYKKIINLLK